MVIFLYVMPFSHRSLLTIEKNEIPLLSGSESELNKQTIKNQLARLPNGSLLAICVVACLAYMSTAESIYFSKTSVKFQQTTH
jgi:hypothetical protein